MHGGMLWINASLIYSSTGSDVRCVDRVGLPSRVASFSGVTYAENWVSPTCNLWSILKVPSVVLDTFCTTAAAISMGFYSATLEPHLRQDLSNLVKVGLNPSGNQVRWRQETDQGQTQQAWNSVWPLGSPFGNLGV
uniref:Uncharacterized protein n=1 Tax=Timema tahoe TaxID=61484 RepID=A0A7R9FFU3_9NEOP|nr:unnamed protein product [Timema tahoe]